MEIVQDAVRVELFLWPYGWRWVSRSVDIASALSIVLGFGRFTFVLDGLETC
jgi:hypothetical protein